ncbi:MAG: hypothetical protein WB995_11820 [Candidatus Acidiferrales bacterium]
MPAVIAGWGVIRDLSSTILAVHDSSLSLITRAERIRACADLTPKFRQLAFLLALQYSSGFSLPGTPQAKTRGLAEGDQLCQPTIPQLASHRLKI